MVEIEWRFKRSTKIVHAFRVCGDLSLCGRMLAANGPITHGRTSRCKFCEVDAQKLCGGGSHGECRNNSSQSVASGR